MAAIRGPKNSLRVVQEKAGLTQVAAPLRGLDRPECKTRPRSCTKDGQGGMKSTGSLIP
jgi:hypothetical protein